jgi:peptide/nickel transport system substrate-binding protein
MDKRNWWFRSRRLSRRGFVRGSAALAGGIAIGAVAGCRSDDTPSEAVSGGTPKYGGTYRPALTAAGFREFDPHENASGTKGQLVWLLISSRIIDAVPESLDLQPGVASSWEIPSEREFLFRLNPAVKWHDKPPLDGRKFTSEDLAFNLMRMAGKFRSAGLVFPRAGGFVGMQSAEAVDSEVVRVRMDRPNSAFLRHLLNPRSNLLIPREVIGSRGAIDGPHGFIGVGPFIVADFDQNSGAARFVKNPEYWEKGRPYLDEVVWGGGVGDGQIERIRGVSALIAGQVDVMTTLTKPEIDTISRAAPNVQITSSPFPVTEGFVLNQNKAPFNDIRVRRAFKLALDYPAFGAKYGDGNWQLSGPVGSAYSEAMQPDELEKLPGYRKDRKESDLAEAKSLMSAAGVGGGFSFELLTLGGIYESNAVILKEQIERTWPGMRVNINLPAGGIVARRGRGDFEALSDAYTGEQDPALQIDVFFTSTASRNFTGASDTQLDQLAAKLMATFEEKQREALVKEIEARVMDASITNIYLMPRGVTGWGPDIRGIRVGPSTARTQDDSFVARYVWKEG